MRKKAIFRANNIESLSVHLKKSLITAKTVTFHENIKGYFLIIKVVTDVIDGINRPKYFISIYSMHRKLRITGLLDNKALN